MSVPLGPLTQPSIAPVHTDPRTCRHNNSARRLTDIAFLITVVKLRLLQGQLALPGALPRLGGRSIGRTSDSGSDYPGSSPGLPANPFSQFQFSGPQSSGKLLGSNAGPALRKVSLPRSNCFQSSVGDAKSTSGRTLSRTSSGRETVRGDRAYRWSARHDLFSSLS